MAFINKRIDELGLVTIDEDRNIVLNDKGTNREGFTFFDLHWKNEVIEFYAYQKPIEFDEDGTADIYWDITMLAIPENLEKEREDIKTFITEALDAYGYIYDRKNIKNVEVKFATNF